MVGFHVIDDEIVDGAVAYDLTNVGQILCKKSHVDRVDERHLLIGNDIRIVLDACREKPKPLKAVLGAVVDAYIMNVLCDFHLCLF